MLFKYWFVYLSLTQQQWINQWREHGAGLSVSPTNSRLKFRKTVWIQIIILAIPFGGAYSPEITHFNFKREMMFNLSAKHFVFGISGTFSIFKILHFFHFLPVHVVPYFYVEIIVWLCNIHDILFMPSLTFPLCSGGGQSAAHETSKGHSGCTVS